MPVITGKHKSTKNIGHVQLSYSIVQPFFSINRVCSVPQGHHIHMQFRVLYAILVLSTAIYVAGCIA